MTDNVPGPPIRKRDLSTRFYDILERLLHEIDQQSIRADVEALKAKHPDVPLDRLAMQMTRAAGRKAAAVGAAAGTAGGASAILALAPDIFNLVRQQSRLILSIAFLYGRDPDTSERLREVVATLAVATGATAGRQAIRKLVAHGLEHEVARQLARKVAGRYLARKLPSVAPIVGSVLGGTLNYLAVQSVGKAAIAYYSRDPKAIDALTDGGRRSRPQLDE